MPKTSDSAGQTTMFYLDPNITILVIGAINAFIAWMAYRTQKLIADTHLLTKQVEVATNSMKDALVKATGEAAHAAGKDEGRLEGEIKAATLAKGKLKG